MKQIPLQEEHTRALLQAGLDPAALSGISALQFEPGEAACTAEEPLPWLLLPTAGRAKASVLAENGRELLLCFSHPGDIIGDLELLLGEDAAQTTIRAVTRFVCAAIPLARNREALRGNAAFLNHAGAALAKKLRDSTENSAHIILYPLETRLCAYIEAMAREGRFSEPLTETAGLLGTSYRHLLRALGALTARSVLEKERRSYRIKDAAALHALGRGLY